MTEEHQDTTLEPVVLRFETFEADMGEDSGIHFRSSADRPYWLLIEPRGSVEGAPKLLIVSDIKPHAVLLLFHVLTNEEKGGNAPGRMLRERYLERKAQLAEFIQQFRGRIIGGGRCTETGEVLDTDEMWTTYNFEVATPAQWKRPIKQALPDAVRILLSKEDLDITIP